MVLQYAMCDGEARVLFTADPTLAHLHRIAGFEVKPGVEVMGAGSAQVNGWYHRREAFEGPPRANPNWTYEYWMKETECRPWYEKDDGCHIYWNCTWRGRAWICCDGSRWNDPCYKATCKSFQNPPARGWVRSKGGSAPAPTLRVVTSEDSNVHYRRTQPETWYRLSSKN